MDRLHWPHGDAAERLELKKLYHALFRNGLNLRAAVLAAQGNFQSAPARLMLEFIASAKRGVCSDVGSDEAANGDEEE